MNTPNSIIIGGPHAGTRIYAAKDQYRIVHQGTKYYRASPWMVQDQPIFVPQNLSIKDLIELLVLSYEKLLKLEKEGGEA
jgi:hypothetical protein